MVCPMPIRYNRINNNHTFTGFSMIEIYLLEQLAAFSKYGTLVGAADALHITQPALSRSMKKLENKFGVSLFHRENS
ncbi:MAG: LysR family transcriptional regulator, partial [Flexilinea sp.]|nr:LysR family transcriptional regulator [Flexilinea sp.]